MKQMFVLAQNKKKLFLTLFPIIGVVFALFSIVLIPGKTLPAFAHPICDPGWQYDIQSTGLSYKPLSDPQFLRNPYRNKYDMDLTITKIKTVTASFDAEISAELGLLFEKV